MCLFKIALFLTYKERCGVMKLVIRRTLIVWFTYLNHMTWGSTWEFPTGLRISCGFRIPWGTGTLFSQALNGWCITDELTDANSSVGYSEELNNKQQHPSENAKGALLVFQNSGVCFPHLLMSVRVHWYCGSSGTRRHINKQEADGGAWEACELAFFPQTQECYVSGQKECLRRIIHGLIYCPIWT